MDGWESWAIAISAIIIAIGMIIMIATFITVLVSVKRLISGASKLVSYFRFAESDPVGELMNSFESFFEKKGSKGKVASLLKLSLIGFLLWQKFARRRKR